MAGAPALPALDNTYGALTLGTVFGLMLYGLTVHQTYRYSRLYPKDGPWLKRLVCGILAFETLHTTLGIAAVYYHLVTNYFNPATLLLGHWSTRLLTPTTGLTIILCQSFYAFRVYVIGSHYIYRVLVGLAAVFMFTSFGFMVAATVEGFILSLSDFKRVSWLVSAMFGFAVLVDVCLTGTLVTVLLRSRTGFKRTDSLIEVLIVYAINTGLLTSIFGLLCFIFAIILPGNLIYIGFSIVGVKLYANSVLAVLNSRRSLSDRMFESAFEMGSFEPGRFLQPPPHGGAEAWKAQQMPVRSLPTNTEIVFTSVQSMGGNTDSTGLSTAEYDKRHAHEFV
ncbi:uncharacterized protein TRAVEDRAFT_32023 [Trametes versicolor FP-101664 SS1]|uniref:uncharacterized protein n=1 Tax=Trametes versicolor (strain FP-101664) TaxID=717944 RepID=UPI00046243CF|nr:uncharacterized protein TRAVEDRAFT_32023 [Trametes versicolor FP-101664 SS1]EIW52174.1 hypothetical protein TRAVEDRAFT_32023 [Trametes versicolor FP-101664 SS1]